jgi:hypothetical protein
VFVELKNNLAVLEYCRRHPGTPQTALPGDLRWVSVSLCLASRRLGRGPTKGNHATDASGRGEPSPGILRADDAYGRAEQSLLVWNAINDAHRFDLVDPDPTHLSSQQLEEAINLSLIALQRHVTFGYSAGRVAHEYPNRSHTITWDLIDTLRPTAATLDPKGMAIADERTKARLKAANSGPGGNVIDRSRSITETPRT